MWSKRNNGRYPFYASPHERRKGSACIWHFWWSQRSTTQQLTMFFTNFCITISYTTISTGSAAAEFSVRAVPGFLKQFNSNTRYGMNANNLMTFFMPEVSIWLLFSRSPTDALTEAFVRTDIAFREELILHQKSKRITQKNWHPGCTAVTALIVRNKLFVANAGDCRAILNRAGEPFPMTRVRIIFLLYFARFLKFKHYNIRYVFILPW